MPNPVIKDALSSTAEKIDLSAFQHLIRSGQIDFSAMIKDGTAPHAIHNLVEIVFEKMSDCSFAFQLIFIKKALASIPGRVHIDISKVGHDNKSPLWLILEKFVSHRENCGPQMLDLLKLLRQFHGFDINIQVKGLTFLMLAAAMPESELAEYICKIPGVNVDLSADDGATALHYAVQAPTSVAADAIIAADAQVNVMDAFGMTPLVLARHKKQYELADRILTRLDPSKSYLEMLVENPNFSGWLSYHLYPDNVKEILATETIAKETVFNFIDLVASHAESLASMNENDSKSALQLLDMIIDSKHVQIEYDEFSLLVQAIKKNLTVHARSLINSGKCKFSPDTTGRSLLSIAYESGSIIFNYLIEARASLDDHILSRVPTLLMLAAAKGDVHTIKLILANYPSCNVNQVDANGASALHYAALFNQLKCVRVLLSANHINPKLVDSSQCTPIDIAMQHNFNDVENIIRGHILLKGEPPTLSQRLSVVRLPGVVIPEEFLDPIYHVFIADPVESPSGKKYDRGALRKYFGEFPSDLVYCNKTSEVLTRQMLSSTPNYTCRNILEGFVYSMEALYYQLYPVVVPATPVQAIVVPTVSVARRGLFGRSTDSVTDATLDFGAARLDENAEANSDVSGRKRVRVAGPDQESTAYSMTP